MSSRSNVVVAHPIGGLGNQLFNFTASMALAKKLGVEVVADLADVGPGRDQHGITLDQLFPDLVKLNSRDDQMIYYLFNKGVRKACRGLGGLGASILLFARIFESGTVGHNDKLLTLKKPVHVHGYFQSFEYFRTISDTFPKLQARHCLATSWSRTIADEMRQTSGRNIGVHVRRGDYQNESLTLGLLDDGYYSRALNLLNVNSEDVVWIFSDTPEVAERLFLNTQIDSTVNFATPPKESGPVESLFLLSQMTSLVIANSSFSWWAATLGSDKSLVVAPRPWFRSLGEPLKVRDPKWVAIESTWVVESAKSNI